MEVQLITLDVDGTLLGPDGRLAPTRATAVRRLMAAGVQVILATGKTWPAIQQLWQCLGLPGPHIACNGAAIVDSRGRVLDRSPLAPDVVRAVTSVLSNQGIAHAIYLDDGSIVTSALDPALKVLSDLDEPTPTLAPWDGLNVLKVLSIVPPGREGSLRSLQADAATITRTSELFLEWNAPNADKGHGLEYAAAALDIDLARSVAVGDAENDRPMLRRAGLGVAVRHATEAAIGAADLHLDTDLTTFLLSLVPTPESRFT